MSNIVTDHKKIDEILTRGVHEIFTKKELKEKLTNGKQLHLKLGTDVTGPNLHLGHTVIHRKIRDFQELGHKVTLIIGDFTTIVGDHSDKVDKRSGTSAEQIKQDEQTYKDQFFKTVLKDQTEIRHNSEWLKDLNFNDIIGLAKHFTIAQILERETFWERFKKKSPIGLDEFLYPLMQGFDSVALECDVEFGGTDQTFNILAGRKLTETILGKPQVGLIMKLLTGSDGRPMGKSLKNFIPVTDGANDMYGKIMSIVDGVIFEYFELVTRVPMDDIERMRTEVKHGANPMEFKKMLAREVVGFYHGESGAKSAEAHFEKTVQRGEVPEEMIIVEAKPNESLLSTLRLAFGEKFSSAEIKRISAQGGVEVNGIKVMDFNQPLENKSGDVIKFKKREFIQIK